MNLRSEACELAKKLARERGGEPSQYMREAWSVVKERNSDGKERVRVSVEMSRDREAVLGQFGRKLKQKVVAKTKAGIKNARSDLNFLKAPRDKPNNVFGSIGSFFTKPTNDRIPPIPKMVRDIFKFK